MKNTKLLALVESALMLALAVVLSYIKFFQLPFDGSITLFSMLPICLVSIKYGIKWSAPSRKKKRKGFGVGFLDN